MREDNEDLNEIFEDQAGKNESSVDDDLLFEDLEEPDGEEGLSASEGAISVGKRTFAIGLTWNLAVGDKSIAKQAKAQASAEDAKWDFYIPKGGEEPQYGLGSRKLGHKAGMQPLAIVLHQILEDNWVGVFSVGPDYYLAAARDDQILSHYDKIYHNEESARDEFSNLLNSADWDRIVAPEGWGIEEAENLQLEAIEIPKKVGKLKHVDPTRNIIKNAILLAIVGGIGYGVKAYMDADAAEKAELLRQARELQRQNEQVDRVITIVEDAVAPVLGMDIPDRQEVEKPPAPPWTGVRNGVGELITCTDDILKISLNVPGWDMGIINCRAGNVQISFSKNGGTINWAEKYLNENGFPELDLSHSVGSDSITITSKASFVSTYAYDLSTQSTNEVRTYLLRHFEEIGVPISWEAHPVSPENIVDRYYERANFNFITDFSPKDLVELFSLIKAFEITNVGYNTVTSEWTVSGSVFHKRNTPLPRPEQY